MISERTIAALAAAKARGQALGNPKLAEARAIANANHTAGADAFADSVAPAIREAQAAGAKTLRQIATALKVAALGRRGAESGRRKRWRTCFSGSGERFDGVSHTPPVASERRASRRALRSASEAGGRHALNVRGNGTPFQCLTMAKVHFQDFGEFLAPYPRGVRLPRVALI